MIEKLKVKWWSQLPYLEKVIPPQPGRVFFDWWYKNIKNTRIAEGGSNIKACPSFPLWFQQGYVIPLWTDVILRYNESTEEFNWETPHEAYIFTYHPKEQLVPFLPEHIKKDVAFILKTECPWRTLTPKGYSSMQLPMFYEYNSLFETLPGIIPTDIWHQTNQQLIIKKSTFKKLGKDCLNKRFLGWRYITLTKGTPLAVYVPFKRENYDYEVVPYPENKELAKLDEIALLKLKGKFHNRMHQLKDSKPEHS
jgi:hypothetical protein